MVRADFETAGARRGQNSGPAVITRVAKLHHPLLSVEKLKERQDRAAEGLLLGFEPATPKGDTFFEGVALLTGNYHV